MKILLKSLFLFVVFLSSFFAIGSKAGSVGSCSVVFSKNFASSENIQLFFSHPKNIEKYTGQQGYLLLAEQIHPHSMRAVFQKISKSLGPKFKLLKWQSFRGSTQEFRMLRSHVLNEQGHFKEEFKTMGGYAKLADEHFAGDMQKTFINVSSIFGGFRNIEELGWKQFHGTTQQYHQLILFFKNTPLEDIKGLDEQKRIAQLIFNSNTRRTYMNVSILRTILFADPNQFKMLGWSRKL